MAAIVFPDTFIVTYCYGLADDGRKHGFRFLTRAGAGYELTDDPGRAPVKFASAGAAAAAFDGYLDEMHRLDVNRGHDADEFRARHTERMTIERVPGEVFDNQPRPAGNGVLHHERPTDAQRS
jgi:hypothetical protein